jgi:serine/threonine protein kinase
MAHPTAGLLKSGELVGPWRIGDRIGQGTFSEIYAAYYNPTAPHISGGGVSATSGKSGSKAGLGDNSRTRAAAKVDRPGPRVDALKWESDLLLRLQKYAFVPRHYGFLPAAEGKVRVLVMQLLGNNISGIRRRQPDGSTLPFGAAVNVALQMLSAVECVHIEGFIHRDLKPSNFVHGLGRYVINLITACPLHGAINVACAGRDESNYMY